MMSEGTFFGDEGGMCFLVWGFEAMGGQDGWEGIPRWEVERKVVDGWW